MGYHNRGSILQANAVASPGSLLVHIRPPTPSRLLQHVIRKNLSHRRARSSRGSRGRHSGIHASSIDAHPTIRNLCSAITGDVACHAALVADLAGLIEVAAVGSGAVA